MGLIVCQQEGEEEEEKMPLGDGYLLWLPVIRSSLERLSTK